MPSASPSIAPGSSCANCWATAPNGSLSVRFECSAVEALMNQQPTNRSENPMPDDVLLRAIASLQREVVPPGPPPELIAATLHVLHEAEQSLQSSLPFIPRT